VRAPAGRIAFAIVVATAAVLGLVPPIAPAPVAAAVPSLSIVGAATYRVIPEEGRVAATVQLTATNHLKDTVTKRYFFRTAYITVLPGTTNFKLSGGSGTPKVSVSSATDTYTNLKLDLGANLAAGKTTTLTLEFDIPDTGGAPDRAVRVSHSLVSFSAWAVATPATPGATVDVMFPAGYNVTVRRGPLSGPTSGGGTDTWSSGVLAAPLDFVADFVADRPSEYVDTPVEVPMSDGVATVRLQSWPDDAAWRDRVASLVGRALPVLEREIGVPWPVDGPLAVHEALLRTTGGFAGLFDPAERRVDVAYAATDGVILHELAHAWFNGRLVGDRWIAEAFAAYYAEIAARELGIEPAAPTLPAEPSPAAIPLNAWGASGTEEPDTEAWAYAASLALAKAIADRAGADALRGVWATAELGTGAYQPGGDAAEPAPGPPDWRGLLDLLEDATGKDFTDLWRTWVARPADLAALADRAATRGYYARSVALAGDWQLPTAVRQAMRAWRFDVARGLLVASDGVQAQRSQLETAAAAAGATLPGTLRAVFEGDGGPAAAAAEANAEQAVVDAIGAAQSAQPTEHGLGEQLIIGIGLIGADPDTRLAVARAAFTAGDLEAAYPAALDAEGAWEVAPRLGRARIISTVLLLAALLLLAGIVRQQRRRRAGAPPGEPAAAA
jgi:hypothetical protein